MYLNKAEIRRLIEDHGLIQDEPHLETQLTPNGFDLTAGDIRRFDGPGHLDFSNDERRIPDATPVEPVKKDEADDYGWWQLEPGTYKVVSNETVDIPDDLVAFTFPRSSLLRMGAFIQNAAWEAGYTGKGTFLLRVDNPDGVHIKENARVNQIVFARLDDETDGYDGVYGD